MRNSFILLVVICVVCACGREPELFVRHEVDRTGITFANSITESDSLNILENEYIFNGGGIAVADFNLDGKEDVFFSGNMVDNHLYLNQGDFRFQEVAKMAGVHAPNRWCSGIATVDINLDGWMDIYVCATNRDSHAWRTNSFFINQGNDDQGVPHFKDMAQAYGLADTSHTTNAAFFDYDKDGDLDIFLIVNEMHETNQPNKYRPKIIDGSSPRTDKLFRNDWDAEKGHPVFTDVSKEAGILIEGFSLGINIVDINRDGWQDVFITNDYLSSDLLYINQQDGTFKDEAEQYFAHTSHSAMGNDVIDINNDGLSDIIAVDMLPEDNYRKKTMLAPNNYQTYINNKKFGYQFQHVRNTFQLNRGLVPDTNDSRYVFSEIAMLSGISATDWSWTPMVADFDNDGLRDIIITNGFPKDVTDRDYVDYFADVANYASKELLNARIPSVKIPNYAYKNVSGVEFEDVSRQWGIEENSFSNGAVYADLDNDGDLDYLVNNINDPAFVFENRATSPEQGGNNWIQVKLEGADEMPNILGTEVSIFDDAANRQTWAFSPYRGYLSSYPWYAHFGLGEMDRVSRVHITWPNGRLTELKDVPANQVLTIRYQEEGNTGFNQPKMGTKPIFQQQSIAVLDSFFFKDSDYIDFNVQRLLPHKLSQYGPGMAVGDVNGDGLEDVYIGGSRFEKGSFLIQHEGGTFKRTDLLPQSNNENREEEMGVLLFDMENDGDLDLYVASGSYEFELKEGDYKDRLFINEGASFSLANTALPSFEISSSCVKAADYDRDGDLDLFVGGRVHPYRYPAPVSSYLLRNDSRLGSPKFSIVNAENGPMLDQFGMVCDALWTDWDNDGWVDLILAAEWKPLTFLKNEQGNFRDVTESSGISNQIGWWNSLAAGDFDKDGDMDYVAGNLGLNTLNRATDTYPIGLYAADLDDNGSYDAIPTVFFRTGGGEATIQEFPFFVRGDVQKQVIAYRQQFPFHHVFGKATIEEMLKDKEAEIQTLKANHLETSYIENLGDGTFAIRSLPIEAQFAPVYGMLVGDFDADAHLDVLMVGNDFGTEVSQGRYDASFGLLLKGKGNGNFEATSPVQSGFFVPGDAKSLARVSLPNSELLIAGINDDYLSVHKWKQVRQKIRIEPIDSFVWILENGKRYKIEFTYGNTFLSQSSRSFSVPIHAEEIEIVDFLGNTRKVNLQN